MDTDQLTTVLKRFPQAKRDALIPMLQAVQDSAGYVSQAAMVAIGRQLGLAAAKVYGVATFYNQFRFQPVGRYHIQICRGTACHVKGSAAVLEALQFELGLQAGQTTRDGLFSLEVVACIGACGLAPVISVNGEFHADLNPEKVRQLLTTLQKAAKEGAAHEPSA